MPASTDQVEMSGAAFVPVCVKVHGSSPPRKRWGTLIQSAIAKTVPWPASDRGFAYKATARGGLKRVNALTAISSPAGARSRPAGVSSSVVVGGRPLWFAFRTQLGLRAMSEKCHVWTAPGWQGLSSRLQHWSVRPCVRPVDAVHMTAGHNALRGSGPGQNPAFDYALALGSVDSRDSLLGANQIQGCFWEAVLGVMERLVLSDAAWERMAPLIIGRPDQKGSTGRDNRMFVEGVLWIVRTGSPWRDLPEAFGDWNSVFRRFSRWSLKGVWWRIFEAMSDDPDFEYLIVDSTIVRAHQHAAGAKKGSLKIRRSAARAVA